MRLLRRTALAFPLSVVACSSNSPAHQSAPVIDRLTVPSSFMVTPCNDAGTGPADCTTGVAYLAQGTITFHDDGGQVTQMRLRFPAYSLDSTSATPTAQAQGTMQVVFGFVAAQAIASGAQVEMDVSLLDGNGVESNVEVEEIAVP